MFRTRDFILIFTVIVFLVTAIGATVLLQLFGVHTEPAPVDLVATAELGEASAFIAASDSLTRAERVADMRNKIAAQSIMQAPESEPDMPVEEDVATTSPDELVAAEGLQQCQSYQEYAGFWDARDLVVHASEGAILVVRSVFNPLTGLSSEETVLQLPKRLVAAPIESCIGSDVIAVANDGSLIRNDEVALYSIFGSDTQIGYSLDGFPVYGTSQTAGNVCGGKVVGGQFRYELQQDQDTIINCFAAAPVKLP